MWIEEAKMANFILVIKALTEPEAKSYISERGFSVIEIIKLGQYNEFKIKIVSDNPKTELHLGEWMNEEKNIPFPTGTLLYYRRD